MNRIILTIDSKIEKLDFEQNVYAAVGGGFRRDKEKERRAAPGLGGDGCDCQ